jgi:glutamate-1-semialdehyde 2,1-aminomutase
MAIGAYPLNDYGRRALSVFPAGIANGEYGLPPDLVTVIARGDGCRLWDVEEREFLDFSMGWGSALVGHGCSEVGDAIRRQSALGTNFAFLNAEALILGEEIQRISRAAERVRFCASGTEATMYCERLARAWTKQPKVLKFEGAYHGASETGVTSLFPSGTRDFPEPELTSAGTPPVSANLLIAPFNDLATVRSIISDHRDCLAAVIVEPLQRCTPPVPGFIEGVRELCDSYGVLLIFDEVVTGFRLAYGGAQEVYGVIPDLVAYGKALGGGTPIGAFAGRTDIMDQVCEHRIGTDDYVWMASTLGGNPISMAAANAALGVLRKPGTYDHLYALGDGLRDGLRQVLYDRGLTATVLGDGPLAQVVFADGPIRDYRSAARGDRVRARAVMLELFRRGVFVNPMGTKLYLSVAHDQAAITEFLLRFDTALAATG